MEGGKIYKFVFDTRAYNDIATWGDFGNKLIEKFNEELELEEPFPTVSTSSSDRVRVNLPSASLKGNSEIGVQLQFSGDDDMWPRYFNNSSFDGSSYLFIGLYMGNAEYHRNDWENTTYYYQDRVTYQTNVTTNSAAFCFIFDTTMWTPDCPIYTFSMCRVDSSGVITEYPASLYQHTPIVICHCTDDTTKEIHRAIFSFNSRGYGVATNNADWWAGVSGTLPTQSAVIMRPSVLLRKLRVQNHTFANEHLYITYDNENPFVSATQYRDNVWQAPHLYKELKDGDKNFKILLRFSDFNGGSTGYPIAVIKS